MVLAIALHLIFGPIGSSTDEEVSYLLLLLFFRLLKMGAMDVNQVVNEHQLWRLVSCMWLHAGVFHVLANMLSLIFVGIRLEQEFGFGMANHC